MSIEEIARKTQALETPPMPREPEPAPPPPTEPIKPALRAIHFGARIVETTVGAAQMTPSEEAAIAKIALRAFKRSVAELVGALEHSTSVRRGRPRGSRTLIAKAKAAPTNGAAPTPKRRGRPPKARTVTHEPGAVAQS